MGRAKEKKNGSGLENSKKKKFTWNEKEKLAAVPEPEENLEKSQDLALERLLGPCILTWGESSGLKTIEAGHPEVFISFLESEQGEELGQMKKGNNMEAEEKEI